MVDLSELVVEISEGYSGYMKYARLLKLVERMGRVPGWEAKKDYADFIGSTLMLVYESATKEGMYG